MELNKEENRKNIIKNIGLIFIGLLLFLTYFSKTISNFMLPQIDKCTPASGVLVSDIETQGVIVASNVKKLYATTQWKIKEVKVKENQAVTAGVELFSIDMTDANIQIKALENDISFSQIEIEKYQNLFGSLETDATATAQSKRDYELNLLEKQKDLALKKQQLEAYKAKFPSDGIIRSAYNGNIKNIKFEEGATYMEGQPLCEISIADGKFIATFQLNAIKATSLNIGDGGTFNVENNDPTATTAGGSNQIIFQGSVTSKIYATATSTYNYEALITPQANTVKDGDVVNVNASKPSVQYSVLVPKGAITHLGGEDCVYVIKERSGALGSENYVEQVKVTIKASDDFRSAIDVQFDDFSPDIVAYSTKPLVDGMQVRLR